MLGFFKILLQQKYEIIFLGQLCNFKAKKYHGQQTGQQARWELISQLLGREGFLKEECSTADVRQTHQLGAPYSPLIVLSCYRIEN